jgi:hypothetical protein
VRLLGSALGSDLFLEGGLGFVEEAGAVPGVGEGAVEGEGPGVGGEGAGDDDAEGAVAFVEGGGPGGATLGVAGGEDGVRKRGQEARRNMSFKVAGGRRAVSGRC